MQGLTKFCGLLFLIFAGLALILGAVDLVPEANDAAHRLVERGGPMPIATSVKYKIGGEFIADVIVAGGLAIFGWFLFTSEIQQTWAVVLTSLIVVAAIVIRATPLMPLSVGKVSSGSAFWGAEVYADIYRPPVKSGARRRNVLTFPQPQHLRLGVTATGLSGEQPHAAETVVLNFGKQPSLVKQYDRCAGGARLIGSLAGTRTILDYDFDRIVYSVPHLMVQKVEPLSGGSG